MKPAKVVRLFLLASFLMLYAFSKFFPEIHAEEIATIKKLCGIGCLLLALPGLFRILRMYFLRMFGRTDIHVEKNDLPPWLAKRLEGEADSYRRILDSLKKK